MHLGFHPGGGDSRRIDHSVKALSSKWLAGSKANIGPLGRQARSWRGSGRFFQCLQYVQELVKR